MINLTKMQYKAKIGRSFESLVMVKGALPDPKSELNIMMAETLHQAIQNHKALTGFYEKPEHQLIGLN